ncbi:MAG: ABC transporter ATP-binding protein [Bacteroidota bacterium]|nr:ABC transporter ATP-binding protein [Bacteroidota bacterium]
METIIVENIYKYYPAATKKERNKALNGISFTVKNGEIFGLIGPDGAGKTSLFHILTTLLLADGGRATVDGFDVVKDYKQIRKRVGYMPGRFSLYQDLTVEENLQFFATAFETTVEKNLDLIHEIYIQLEPFKKRRAGKLSGGMKQKLALCCALIHKPSVLFLDEPTTGVDPVSRKEFWQMLKSLQLQGITTIVSTPYMDEANLCDRIGLLQNGSLLGIDTPENLTRNFGKPLFALKAEQMYPLLLHMRAYDQTATCYGFGDYHHITFIDPHIQQADIRSYLQGVGFTEPVEIRQIAPGIEDCFMDLLNH